MQTGSSEALTEQELPGLEEFHCVISPGMEKRLPVQTHPVLARLASQTAALWMNLGYKHSPLPDSSPGSCKEASLCMRKG